MNDSFAIEWFSLHLRGNDEYGGEKLERSIAQAVERIEQVVGAEQIPG